MDILGLRIERKNGNLTIKRSPTKIVIADRVPEVKVTIPDTKKPAIIPSVKSPTLRYNSNRYRGRGQFAQAEYDLAEAGRVEDTDSYVRQAFDKKVALMFKEGWDVVGKNPRTVKYIRQRFAQIARASGTPTAKLFRELGSSLIRKSNAFVVKVRKPEASGGKSRKIPGKDQLLKPVAAYFVTPAEAMEYQLVGNKISRWRQKMPDGSMKAWAPRDVEHFYYDRKDGFVFGTPPLVPVVDDIRALRKIEENIELLVYQHLFPLFQYKVGTPESPAGFDEAGHREIDLVKQEIQYMPTEGGIVTPERHEIIAVGAEGRALRAEGYLEHFKKRVFAGLGLSAVDYGEGDTANRATADNMSRNLVDAVKDLQQVLEIFINEFVIGELLLESTFGDSVLDDENRCFLKFKEIDIEAQIKKEAHYADQFNKDMITWDEARTKIGFDPIIVPTPEEAENGTDHPEAYPEWHKTRWKLFKEPELLIQSIDEPYSLAAKMAVMNNSIGLTGQQAKESTEEKKKQEVDLEKEKTKAKVAVAKAKPAPKATSRKDGFLQETFMSIKEDVVQRASQPEFDTEWVISQIRTAMEPTIDRLVAEQLVAYRDGYVRFAPVKGDIFFKNVTSARKRFRSRSEKYINKVTNSVVSAIKKQPDSLGSQDLSIRVRAIFDVIQFRTRFIEDVEVRKAKNFGTSIAARFAGFYATYSSTKNPDACTTCKSFDDDSITLKNITMESIAPHHANCHCTINFIKFTDNEDGSTSAQTVALDQAERFKPGYIFFDAAGETDDIVPSSDVQDCPKCGKSAIRMKDMPDVFNCRSCRTSFKVKRKGKVSKTPDTQDELPEISQMDTVTDDDFEDKIKRSKHAEYRRCVSKVKARLKSKDPEMEDDELQTRAETACEAIRNMLKEDDILEDGVKLEKCVMSVKTDLKKRHPDWSTDKIKSSAFAICNAKGKK